jgi:glycosyltransferase involved in cell wall biosynthesis
MRVRNAALLAAGRLGGAAASQVYWHLYPDAVDIYREARRIEADIWLANDWAMLPVARTLAREKGGVYGYDTHELATEEFGDRLRWRFWKRPLVRAIEAEFIREAAVVSAVSDGVAKRLAELYALTCPSTVVRNTPPFERIQFHPTGAGIHVLYHGILAPGRGLEATIDSVPQWHRDADLTIRGFGDPGYIDTLERRIAGHRLENRVRLSPPVSMTDLIRKAAAFDIGLVTMPNTSKNNELALPNKFFEYVMAGLALLVTDLPEMARLVRLYKVGATVPAAEPALIAAAINALDRVRIDTYKKNALQAARELCWEHEARRLVAAYAALYAVPAR